MIEFYEWIKGHNEGDHVSKPLVIRKQDRTVVRIALIEFKLANFCFIKDISKCFLPARQCMNRTSVFIMS